MTEALRKFLGARKSSAGFYRAGWLAAIVGLRRAYKGADLPPMSERDAKKMTGYKRLGGFTAATAARPTAKIVNHTFSRFDPHQRALVTIGAEPLQRAFDEEARGMQREYERRLRQMCRKLAMVVR
jgi:hypothetical protein